MAVFVRGLRTKSSHAQQTNDEMVEFNYFQIHMETRAAKKMEAFPGNGLRNWAPCSGEGHTLFVDGSLKTFWKPPGLQPERSFVASNFQWMGRPAQAWGALGPLCLAWGSCLFDLALSFPN